VKPVPDETPATDFKCSPISQEKSAHKRNQRWKYISRNSLDTVRLERSTKEQNPLKSTHGGRLQQTYKRLTHRKRSNESILFP
jgi:hypothetical protein